MEKLSNVTLVSVHQHSDVGDKGMVEVVFAPATLVLHTSARRSMPVVHMMRINRNKCSILDQWPNVRVHDPPMYLPGPAGADAPVDIAVHQPLGQAKGVVRVEAIENMVDVEDHIRSGKAYVC